MDPGPDQIERRGAPHGPGSHDWRLPEESEAKSMSGRSSYRGGIEADRRLLEQVLEAVHGFPPVERAR